MAQTRRRETRPDREMVSIGFGRTNEAPQAVVAILRRANNSTFMNDPLRVDVVAPKLHDLPA